MRAGQHLAAIDDFDVVRPHIQVVVDADESRLLAQIVFVARHAFAAGIARPVARQHAGRRAVGRRRRRWPAAAAAAEAAGGGGGGALATTGGGGGLGGSVGLHMLDLVLEVVLQGGEFGLQLLLVGLRIVERRLQHRRRIGRRLGRRRRRRLVRGDVQRRIDRRAGAQQPRGDQQQNQEQQPQQQGAPPARPAERRQARSPARSRTRRRRRRGAAQSPARRGHEALQARQRVGLVAPGDDHRLAVDQVDVVVRRPARGELQRAADQPRLVAGLRAAS